MNLGACSLQQQQQQLLIIRKKRGKNFTPPTDRPTSWWRFLATEEIQSATSHSSRLLVGTFLLKRGGKKEGSKQRIRTNTINRFFLLLRSQTRKQKSIANYLSGQTMRHGRRKTFFSLNAKSRIREKKMRRRRMLEHQQWLSTYCYPPPPPSLLPIYRTKIASCSAWKS